MTFAATIQAGTLSTALDSVSVLVDECKIHTETDGVEIAAVDPANVAMADLTISKAGFESYDADGGVLGVNLERLEDVVGMADSDDLVHLELDEETRKLHITIDGLEYTLALIDPDAIRQEPDIPELDLPGTYVSKGAAISRGLTAADLVSDHVAMRGGEGELVISADGDTDDVEVTLDDDDLLSVAHTGDDRVESLFSLDYLSAIESAIDGESDVSLLLGEEMPIKLRHSQADGDVSAVHMVAPRIQSE